MNKSKWLLAFDMDFTILQENSDYEVRKLLPDDVLQNLQNNEPDCWIKIMQSYFDAMKKYNIPVSKIKQCIQSMELTKGMKDLLEYIKLIKDKNEETRLDIIILSGANMLFVEWVLEAYNLKDLIDEYYSFSCDIDNDRLVLGPLHEHNCDDCHAYLCKKLAIENIIQKNNSYEKIIYFGDGQNDYCACLALNLVKGSIVYIREDYALDRLLYHKKGCVEKRNKILAELVKWKDGYDILDHIKLVLPKLTSI